MTRQDWLCWFWVLDGLSPELCHALRHESRESDQRDADLMRRCCDWRWIPNIGIRPESVRHWSNDATQLIDCGGDLSADWYHHPMPSERQLKSAPLTLEDEWIMLMIRKTWGSPLDEWYRMSDRSDAEILYLLRYSWQYLRDTGCRESTLWRRFRTDVETLAAKVSR